ncbi:MAG: MAPEG family protein [Pseudomonadota bacterium]
MQLPITMTLVAVCALILCWLKFRTIGMRTKYQASMGDADKPDLQIAIRSHGNFTENAPIAIILVGLLEFSGAPQVLVGALAAAFVVARLLHPLGMTKQPPNVPRVAGVVMTTAVFVVGAIYALYMTWL